MVLRSEEEVGGSKEENKLEIRKKGLWCDTGTLSLAMSSWVLIVNPDEVTIMVEDF